MKFCTNPLKTIHFLFILDLRFIWISGQNKLIKKELQHNVDLIKYQNMYLLLKFSNTMNNLIFIKLYCDILQHLRLRWCVTKRFLIFMQNCNLLNKINFLFRPVWILVLYTFRMHKCIYVYIPKNANKEFLHIAEYYIST